MDVNSFIEMANSAEFSAWWWGLSSEDLLTMLLYAEREVRTLYPNAKLLFSSSGKGITTHVGIYDLPLQLNFRHNFNVNQQYAPQLISKTRFDYQEYYGALAKQRTIVEVWMSAAIQLRSSGAPK